jgi:hypothetical protein
MFWTLVQIALLVIVVFWVASILLWLSLLAVGLILGGISTAVEWIAERVKSNEKHSL